MNLADLNLSAFTVDSIYNIISPAFLTTLGAWLALPFVFYTIECFFGYQVFRVKCLISGFASGASAGLLLANYLQFDSAGQIGAALILGGLAAFSAFRFYKFGVFYTTAIVAFPIGYAIYGMLGGAIAALVLGIVAVFLIRYAIIGTSAYSGGTGLAACIFTLLKLDNPILVIICGIIICVLGVLTQLKSSNG